MKKIIAITLFFCISTTISYSQAPNLLNYQAVARSSNGNAITNQLISVRFTVKDGSITGTIVYQERDTATTNQFGLFTTQIGGGTVLSGTFSGINWSTGNKYLEVEFDPNGGNTFTQLGTSQLISVPYALYAGAAATVINSSGGSWSDYAEYDEQAGSGSSPATSLTNSTWATRQISSTVTQVGSSISLNGTTITLDSGTYHVSASAQWGLNIAYNINYNSSYSVGNGQLRLMNTTTSTTAITALGENVSVVWSPVSGLASRGAYTLSLDGVITVSSPSSFELEQYVNYTNPDGTASVDAGAPVSSGEHEIYSRITIQKIN